MSKAALGVLCLISAMPAYPAAGTVMSVVADCASVGGSGRWSNPANWSPMQVPDNGAPQGTAYEVVVQSGCLSMLLDMSATVNRLFMSAGYWNGTKQKAPKVSANGVSLTVLEDARIDELGMTNGKLSIGGTVSIPHADGWVLTATKVKAGNYLQSAYAQAYFLESSIETTGRFLIADWAWAQLTGSALETGRLELSGGALLLRDGSTVKVKGDFQQGFDSASGLGFELDGATSFTVDGNALLGGSLYGWFSNGYTPAVGEVFPLLRAKGSIIGNWTGIRLPQLPAGRAWSVVIEGGAAYAKVVLGP